MSLRAPATRCAPSTLRLAGMLLVLACLPAAGAAQQIVQGVLQLQWGDARPVAAGERAAPRFEAWLDVGSGIRLPLDTAQSRRAAGDLHALAHRRVAVSYASGLHGGLIDAIVPVDAPFPRDTVRHASGRMLAAAAVQGSTRWVTLMCRFADVVAEPKPRAFFQQQYGAEPGQLGHYWSEASYGRIDLAGSTAHGWYALPRVRAAYVTTVNGVARVDLNALFAECTAQADAEVDFNGVQGINLMFNAELDGRAWGGGACAVLDGTYRCLRTTWNPPWAFANLAGLAHEMGHGYGLPHSDNTDGDADTHDNPWDVMSDAWRHATQHPVYGLLPKHPSMVQRDRLGWVPAARKRVLPVDNQQVHEIHLDAAGLHDAGGVQMIVLEGVPQPDPYRTVVHVVEARRRGGHYEGALAGDAVIIHGLQDYGIARSVDADVPAADLAANEGSMFKPGEAWSTPDGRHHLQVLSATDTGFVVRIGPRPRVMSAPMPARVRSVLPASAPATPSSTQRMRLPPPAVPPRICSAEKGFARPRPCLRQVR